VLLQNKKNQKALLEGNFYFFLFLWWNFANLQPKTNGANLPNKFDCQLTFSCHCKSTIQIYQVDIFKAHDLHLLLSWMSKAGKKKYRNLLMLSIVNSTPFRNHVSHDLHYLEASTIVIYYVSLQEKLPPIKKWTKSVKVS